MQIGPKTVVARARCDRRSVIRDDLVNLSILVSLLHVLVLREYRVEVARVGGPSRHPGDPVRIRQHPGLGLHVLLVHHPVGVVLDEVGVGDLGQLLLRRGRDDARRDWRNWLVVGWLFGQQLRQHSVFLAEFAGLGRPGRRNLLV